MPVSTSSWSRAESMVREIRGSPRWISPKRRLPANSSRTTSSIHRWPRTSSARAMEQNWPELVIVV
jgi:hypothetical protein